MATISFFVGFEIKETEKALKVLGILQEPGVPVSLTPEEKELLKKQEEAGKSSIDKLSRLLDEL